MKKVLKYLKIKDKVLYDKRKIISWEEGNFDYKVPFAKSKNVTVTSTNVKGALMKINFTQFNIHVCFVVSIHCLVFIPAYTNCS